MHTSSRSPGRLGEAGYIPRKARCPPPRLNGRACKPDATRRKCNLRASGRRTGRVNAGLVCRKSTDVGGAGARLLPAPGPLWGCGPSEEQPRCCGKSAIEGVEREIETECGARPLPRHPTPLVTRAALIEVLIARLEPVEPCVCMGSKVVASNALCEREHQRYCSAGIVAHDAQCGGTTLCTICALTVRWTHVVRMHIALHSQRTHESRWSQRCVSTVHFCGRGLRGSRSGATYTSGPAGTSQRPSHNAVHN
jgi:hypothetical protein